MHSQGEISPEVVDCFAGREDICGVLVGVGADVAHTERTDAGCGEIDGTEDDHLAVGGQFGKPCDKPTVGVLDRAADLTLNIDCGFSGVEAVEDRAEGDSGAAVLFDGWDCGGIAGELDLYGSAFGDKVLSGEFNQNFNIFLSNVDIILTAHHAKTEPGYTTSQLQPPVTGSNRVGNGLGPSARLEGVGFEVGVYSGNGEGQLGDERLETDDGAVAYFDCQPVDGRVYYAILVVRFLAVEDSTAEGELRIQIHNPPIVLLESRSSRIRSHVDKLVGHADRRSGLEQNSSAVWFVESGDAFGHHIDEHVEGRQVKLTLDVGGDVEGGYLQGEIYVDLFGRGRFHLGEEET